MTTTEFSAKERSFFMGCGFDKHIKLVETEMWYISNFYHALPELAFMKEDLTAKQISSLRRLIKAWNDCEPLRTTKEFDDLIEL